MKPISGFHLARFGTPADQKFLLGNFLSTYDQLIINANMVAYMTSALATFISIKTQNKAYLIDPQTHAFQHDIRCIQSQSDKSKGQIKKSIKKLIDAFGEPIASSILREERPVTPRDFKDKRIVRNFCQRVIKFQLETISRELAQSDASKYYKYVGLKASDVFAPTVAIAPYFYLDDKFNNWLRINIACINSSKNIISKYNKPLGIQIVISQDILIDSNKIDTLISEYSHIEADVIFLWIDGFDEQGASENSLKALLNLINRLGNIAPVVNLYGGFFSVVLGKCGISPNLIGVSHGLEYGESRGVVPIGGGFPTAKFYFPRLHTRLLFREAFRGVRAIGGTKSVQGYHKRVCNCKMCKEIIKNDPEIDFNEYGKMKQKPRGKPYPASETKDKTVSHYMWCKKREYQHTSSLKEIIDDLKSTRKILGTTLSSANIRHCSVWSRVLGEYI